MIAALVLLCHMTGPCDQASAVSSFRTLTPITTCGMQAQTAAAEKLFDFGLRLLRPAISTDRPGVGTTCGV
jgi:hypothetical protein